MSALHAPACPTCRADLDLRHDGDFGAWVCPGGHGLACTLSEAYERLRDDEIHAIWHAANAADPARSTRGCPMCAKTMVAVACGPVTLDVCVVDEVLWLDAGELEQLPPDVPDAPPSAEEQAELARITEDFADALDAGWDAEEAHTITGRLAAHLLPSRGRATTTS
jgi:Zn-finger nucleic acid-binding protein